MRYSKIENASEKFGAFFIFRMMILLINFMMMRFFLTVICFLIFEKSFSQIKKTFVSDTSVVEIIVSQGDSLFYINDPFRTGEWIIYYDSGQLVKALHIKYFDSKFRFVDTIWYQNGQMKKEDFLPVKGNTLTYNEWFPDGKNKTKRICYNDSCIQLVYYANGILADKSVESVDSVSPNRMVWHYFEEYYENGQLKSTPYNPNSWLKYSITSYYLSGKIKAQKDEVLGSFTGSYKEWYENGQLKIEGSYEEIPIDGHYHSSKPTGKWSYYNEAGKLTKEEFYENNKLINTITY